MVEVTSTVGEPPSAGAMVYQRSTGNCTRVGRVLGLRLPLRLATEVCDSGRRAARSLCELLGPERSGISEPRSRGWLPAVPEVRDDQRYPVRVEPGMARLSDRRSTCQRESAAVQLLEARSPRE